MCKFVVCLVLLAFAGLVQCKQAQQPRLQPEEQPGEPENKATAASPPPSNVRRTQPAAAGSSLEWKIDEFMEGKTVQKLTGPPVDVEKPPVTVPQEVSQEVAAWKNMPDAQKQRKLTEDFEKLHEAFEAAKQGSTAGRVSTTVSNSAAATSQEQPQQAQAHEEPTPAAATGKSHQHTAAGGRNKAHQAETVGKPRNTGKKQQTADTGRPPEPKNGFRSQLMEQAVEEDETEGKSIRFLEEQVVVEATNVREHCGPLNLDWWRKAVDYAKLSQSAYRLGLQGFGLNPQPYQADSRRPARQQARQATGQSQRFLELQTIPKPEPRQTVNGYYVHDVVENIAEGTVLEGAGPYFLATKDDTVVVAIRGSFTLRDGLVDSAFEMHPVVMGGRTYGLGHLGFVAVWSHYNVLARVRRLMRDHPQIRKVACTGHSLGGALAQLTCMELALGLGLTADVVTFGSPKVGEAMLRMSLRHYLNHFRIRNQNDIVPAVPITGSYPRSPGSINRASSLYVHASDIAVRLNDQSEHRGRFSCVPESYDDGHAPVLGRNSFAHHSLDDYYEPRCQAVLDSGAVMAGDTEPPPGMATMNGGRIRPRHRFF